MIKNIKKRQHPEKSGTIGLLIEQYKVCGGDVSITSPGVRFRIQSSVNNLVFLEYFHSNRQNFQLH